MTIHELFDTREQELINEALEKLYRLAKSIADAPIKGYGRATEYEKKKQWKSKQEEIEELQSKILDLTF